MRIRGAVRRSPFRFLEGEAGASGTDEIHGRRDRPDEKQAPNSSGWGGHASNRTRRETGQLGDMTSRASVSPFLIAIAAGLGSAGLYATLIGASYLALPLFLLAPMPVMIVAVSFGAAPAGLAALVAVAPIEMGLGTPAAAAFAVAMVAPSLLFGHLYLRSRALVASDPDSPRVWYPLGSLLAVMALSVAVVTVVGALAIGFDADQTTGLVMEAIRQTAGPTAPPLGSPQTEAFVRTTVRLMPAAFPATWLVVLVFDLWAAVRLARLSGWVARPREDAATVELPIAAGVAFVAAVTAAVFAPGTAGVIGEIVAGTLVAAHFLVGLAVVHVLVRGSDMRWIILAFVYGTVLLFTLPAGLIALLGLFEPFLGLRRRRASR